MRELLLLHVEELLRVLRLDLERVEAEVARHVALAQRLRRRVGALVELLPPLGDARLLGARDAGEHPGPQPDRQLRDLVDRDVGVAGEERVELLLHEEAERREHRHAAVRELGLAVLVHLELRLALEEVERVELAEDVVAARQAVRELRRGGRLHLDLRRDARRGAGERERERGGEAKHLDFLDRTVLQLPWFLRSFLRMRAPRCQAKSVTTATLGGGAAHS